MMKSFYDNEGTSNDFRKIVDVIDKLCTIEHKYVDVWFDYQMWKKREYLEGGACTYVGDWLPKSIILGQSYYTVTHCDSLRRLDQIPLAYFVKLDLKKQENIINNILIPYLYHFALSRVPPRLFFFSHLNPADIPQEGQRFVDIDLVREPSPAFTVSLSPLLGGLFNVSRFTASSSPEFMLDTGTYALFCFELTPVRLW